MLQYIWKEHKLLIISLLLLLVSLKIEIKKQIPQEALNLSQLQKTIIEQEIYLQQTVDTIYNKLKNDDFSFFNKNFIKELEKNDISFFIYQNDTLKYWSNNEIGVPYLYNPKNFLGQCFFIGNSWVLAEQKEINNFKIITLFSIKKEYSLKNRFFEDKFSSKLNIPRSYKISTIPLSFSIELYNKNKDYLFSIIPAFYDRSISFQLYSKILLFILSFIALILYLNKFINLFLTKKSVVKALLVVFLGLSAKITISYKRFPETIYDNLIPNLCFLNTCINYFDFYLYIIIAFWIILTYKKIINTTCPEKTSLIFYALIVGISINFIQIFSLEIIKNSQTPLNIQNINSFNAEIFSPFLNFALICALVILLIYFTYDYLYISKNKNLNTLIFTTVGFLTIFLYWKLFKNIALNTFLLYTIILIIWYIKQRKFEIKIYTILITAFLFAVYINSLLINSIKSQDKQLFTNIGQKIITESDPTIEQQLEQKVQKLNQDLTLQAYSENPDLPNIENEIIKYLRRNYFNTYFNKYKITVDICSDLTSDKNLIKCGFIYSNRLNNANILIPNNLYSLKMPTKTEYYIILNFKIGKKANNQTNIYITLSPIYYISESKLPKIISSEQEEILNLKYNYALYKNNTLTYSSGIYSYPIELTTIKNKDKNYSHIVIPVDSENTIVVSYQKIKFITIIILFSYIFIITLLTLNLIYLLKNIKKIKPYKDWSIRNKVIIWLVAIITFFWLLITLSSIILTINQNNKKIDKEQLDKEEKVKTFLHEKLLQENLSRSDVLNEEIRKFAKNINSEINIYDQNGLLVATSLPELYNLKIKSEYISPEFIIDRKTYYKMAYVEKLGKISYLSKYTTYNFEGKQYILNTPFFNLPEEIRHEILNQISSILNIFIVILTLIIIFGIFLAEQLIKPIILIQNKIKKLDISKGYEKIDYKNNDEIGELVKEYNRMVEKIQEYIEKLAKSERESAWRDMARQIAHEIKNPLTPMKLSIQLLLHSWDNQDPNFDQRIKDVSRTLINQIETLRRIAEEFSEFAKLPKPQETYVNLVEKIEETCKLFENIPNVEVYPNLRNIKEAYVYADDKQLSRALINLIKNGIQAIPEGIQGKIFVDLDIFGQKAVIKVIDNGAGIPDEIKDKLFTPSFTTKSSGMGLGLTMVKNIIDNAHGKISFKSEVGKGTTFIIELPLVPKPNND